MAARSEASESSSWRTRSAWLFTFAVLAILLLGAHTASADLSEFETWRFDLQDTDDEYPLDHLQAEYPRAWEDAWRSGTAGARLSNNCSSHDLCEVHVEAKVAQEIGRGFCLSYQYFQEDLFSHLSRWNELALRWRTARGPGLGILYRPSFQKSENDIGLHLEWLTVPRRGLQVDMLFQAIVNNRVARRESLRGEERWLYQRQPVLLQVQAFRDFAGSGRLEFDAGLLGPTRRTHYAPSTWLPPPDYRQGLEGRRTRLRIDSPGYGPWVASLELGQKVGRYRIVPLILETDLVGTDVGRERRTKREEWWIRPAVDLRVAPRWRGNCLFEYRAKRETSAGPELPAEGYGYGNLSRSWRAGLSWDAKRFLSMDFGYAGSGISIAPTEDPDWIPGELRHGSRRENRGYATVGFHGNHLALLFTETFELDDEPYDSFLFHDKSFFQIMILE